MREKVEEGCWSDLGGSFLPGVKADGHHFFVYVAYFITRAK